MKELAFDFLAGYVPMPIGVLFVGLALAGVVVGLLGAFAAVGQYLERKISAFVQCRLGPMEVGPKFEVTLGGVTILPRGWHGLLVMVADGLKLLAKEDFVPGKADKPLFRFAPYVAVASTMAAYALLPFGAYFVPADLDAGILFVLAASSVGVTGIVMGGYASNNKWSLYGAMRSVAQVVSYEIPMGLALLTVVMTVGSLSLMEIAAYQAGGFWRWNVFANVWLFIAFVVYLIACLAETNRAPFDIPEAESELVCGYHTEYSGMRWALFFLAEYGNMLLVSLVAAIFFLGGGATGLPMLDRFAFLGPPVLLAKGVLLVIGMIWLRWTLPRYRVDLLMTMCWKGLLPLALVAFLGAGVAVLLETPVMILLSRAPIPVMLVVFVLAVRRGIRVRPSGGVS